MASSSRFRVGQMVEAAVSAQGMTRGAVYEVVGVEVRRTFVGGFTTYQVVAVDGADGAVLTIGNGHLVLKETCDPTSGLDVYAPRSHGICRGFGRKNCDHCRGPRGACAAVGGAS